MCIQYKQLLRYFRTMIQFLFRLMSKYEEHKQKQTKLFIDNEGKPPFIYLLSSNMKNLLRQRLQQL